MEFTSSRVILSRRDCGRIWHHPIRHAEHGDRLELQSLHSVHRADADGVFPRLGREGNGRDARGFQRRLRLLPQPPRPRGDPDRMRLIHNGKEYDSKVIVGVAHGFLLGERALSARDFSSAGR